MERASIAVLMLIYFLPPQVSGQIPEYYPHDPVDYLLFLGLEGYLSGIGKGDGNFDHSLLHTHGSTYWNSTG